MFVKWTVCQIYVKWKEEQKEEKRLFAGYISHLTQLDRKTSAVILHCIIHKRQHIARSRGQGMGYRLWVQIWQTFTTVIIVLCALTCYKSMVSCQKGPTFHAYACQIGPFWQDTFDITAIYRESIVYGLLACPVKFTYSVVVLCFVVFIS